MKASLEKTHLRRAHDEPVTMEAVRSLEEHLTSLARLHEVCARIDQRLAHTEAVSGRPDSTTMDPALRDVCAQMYDRLIRVEAAIQRTEGFVADKPWDQSAIAFKRLERVEDTLRLTQKSVEDSTLPEMCVNIERQITQTRQAIQRTEEAVAGTNVREVCESIDARLLRTEDSLRRTEGIVAEWLRGLSASMTTRFADAEETIQRIERIVSSRTLEQALPEQPSVQMGGRSHATTERVTSADGGVLARAELILRRFVSITQTNRGGRFQGMARLAFPLLVLVLAFAIGALIKTSGGAPEKVVSQAPTDQTSTPVAPVATELVATPSAQAVVAQFRTPSTTALAANAPSSNSDARLSAPSQRSPNRASAPIATRRETFVGSLSITSVPAGASVSINGKPAGVTPLRLPRQRAGSMAVQVARDGFERWSAAVHVPADRLTEVTARLRPMVQ